MSIISYPLANVEPGKTFLPAMINYVFFDEYTNRIYMIDLAVFAPEFVSKKEPFIRQLEVIASTFTTQQRKYK